MTSDHSSLDDVNLAYLGMKAEPDGRPSVASSARRLGVRVGVDVHPDQRGFGDYGGGGMSVAPDDLMHLPPHRRPKVLSGTGLDPVFQVSSSDLGSELTLRRDRADHALAEPGGRVLLGTFERALSESRSQWTIEYRDD
ncbi:hypothetical protein [Engelhardtia mirabilis]|uniref:hypothetical protein n=1 Tax=Engelhardtia mirabilis TaxID=2528011 RepID=UPI0011A44812